MLAVGAAGAAAPRGHVPESRGEERGLEFEFADELLQQVDSLLPASRRHPRGISRARAPRQRTRHDSQRCARRLGAGRGA